MAKKVDKMISVSEEIYNVIKAIAKREERSIRSVVERAVRKYNEEAQDDSKASTDK
jgi:hypothetical protein